MSELLLNDVIFLSSWLSIICTLMVVFAIGDVIRGGLYIDKVTKSMKCSLIGVVACFAISSATSVTRLSHEPSTVLVRELGSSLMSIAIIGLAVAVIRAKRMTATTTASIYRVRSEPRATRAILVPQRA